MSARRANKRSAFTKRVDLTNSRRIKLTLLILSRLCPNMLEHMPHSLLNVFRRLVNQRVEHLVFLRHLDRGWVDEVRELLLQLGLWETLGKKKS